MKLIEWEVGEDSYQERNRICHKRCLSVYKPMGAAGGFFAQARTLSKKIFAISFFCYENILPRHS